MDPAAGLPQVQVVSKCIGVICLYLKLERGRVSLRMILERRCQETYPFVNFLHSVFGQDNG